MSERDEFEAWVREELQFDGEDGDPCKRGQCGYLESNVDSAWCAWQARAARAPQAVPGQVRELIDTAFQAIFDAYNQPGDRFENDYAWCLNVRKKVGDAYTPLQQARAILAAPQPSQEPEKALQHYQD